MSCRSFLAGSLLLSLLVPPFLSAQNSSSDPLPTFKSKVRVVPIEVVVTNSKGEPVSDLKPEDFQIFEQGKPQTIASFHEYTGSTPTVSALSNLPPNSFTNRVQNPAGEAVTIFLLDSLNTPLEDQLFVHQQVVKYFHDMKPGMAVGIFKLSSRLRLLQSFTTNYPSVETLLNDGKMGTWPELSPLLPTTNDSISDAKNLAQMRQMGVSANSVSATQRFQADAAASRLDMRVDRTLAAFQQIAEYLAAVPGRKNVIWFSQSFPLTTIPHGTNGNFNTLRDYSSQLQKTSSLLAKAQVAIYPIEAAGLHVNDTTSAVNSAISRDSAINSGLYGIQNDDASRFSMEALAQETGGKAAYNGNGLVEAIDRAVHHGMHYYALSYSPANKKTDGEFRSIRIEVGQKQYQLDYRRGYYADDAKTLKIEAAKDKNGPLQPLMARGLPSATQITYEIVLQPADPQTSSSKERAGDNPSLKGTLTRYAATFKISTDQIKLETAQDNSQHGKIEINLIAYDREGTALNWLAKSVQFNSKPQAQPPSAKQISFTENIDVPQGDIYLRSGVYDPGSDKVGTMEVSLSAVTIATK